MLNKNLNENNIAEREKALKSSFNRTVATCVLCALVCAAVLASFTWAWIGTDKTNQVADVEAADLKLYMSLKQEVNGVYETVGKWSDDAGLNELTDDFDVEFLKDVKYKLTLYMRGTASSGYCVISDVTPGYLVKDIYTTEAIKGSGLPGDITFIFTPNQTCNLKFEAIWGEPDEEDIVLRLADENNSIFEYSYSIIDGFGDFVPPAVDSEPAETFKDEEPAEPEETFKDEAKETFKDEAKETFKDEVTTAPETFKDEAPETFKD